MGAVKHRAVLVVTGLIAALALVVSLSVAATGSAGTAARDQAAAVTPPPVANAAAIKAKYGGQSITWIGDGAVGKSLTRDQLLVAQFTKAHGHQGQGSSRTPWTRAPRTPAGAELLGEIVLDRRDDAGRRLARSVRAVPRRPQAGARQAGQACTRRASFSTTP